MFLTYSMLGGQDVFIDVPSITPTTTTFSSLKIWGDSNVLSGNNVYVNELELKKVALSDTTIRSSYYNSVIPVGEWSYLADTNFLAHFNNSLECGSFTTGVEFPITGYRIRKRIKDSPLNPILVDIIGQDVVEYTDYTSRNNVEYTYGVYSILDQDGLVFEGAGLEEDVTLSFWGWILTSVEATPTTVYNFDLDLNVSDIKTTLGDKVFETYNQYPSYRKNNIKYASGSLGVLPYVEDEANCKYSFSNSMLQTLEDFLNDGAEKILRNPAGRGYRVITRNVSIKYMSEVQHVYISDIQQPANVSFDFVEIGSPPI